MKKVTLFIAALMVCAASWGAETTLTANIKNFGDKTSTSYEDGPVSGTAKNATNTITVAAAATNFNPSSGQIKGNKESTNSNFSFYNTAEIDGYLKEVSLEVTGTLLDVWNIATGTTSQASATTGTKGTLSGSSKVVFTLDENDKNTYFRIMTSNAKGTSGNTSNAVVTIKYVDKASVVTVNSITLDADTLRIKDGKTGNLTATVDPTSAIVSWKSLDETIASVAATDNSAVVTGLKANDTTKVVAYHGESVSDTCVIVVLEDDDIVWYNLLTDAANLSDGDTIMIGQKGQSVLMGKTQGTSTSNLAPIKTGLKFADEYTKCRRTEGALYVVEADESNWKLKAADNQYLNISAAKSISLSSTASPLSISIGTTNAATIKNANNSGYGSLQYNSSASIFTTYTSAQQDVVIYYFHDPNAGKIECDPTEVVFDNKQLVNKTASGSKTVTVTTTNIPADMLIGLTTHHPEFSISPADELAAAGGVITISYSVDDLVLQNADTTLLDTLTIVGDDLNGKEHTVEIPISVKLLKEYFPQSIGSMLADSIAEVGSWGNNNTDVHVGKSLFLLDTATLVYKATNEYIVKDATAFLAVKSAPDASWAVGDKLVGLFGKLNVQSKRYYFTLSEVVPSKTDKHEAVEAELFTDMPDVFTYVDLSRYIKYEGVNFNSNGIVLGEETLYTLNSYGFSKPNDTDAPYNVEGIVSREGKYARLILTAAPVIDPTYERPVSGVTISKSTLTLNVGNSETLTATVKPDDAFNKNVTWSVTEGAGNVKVDQDGKVTGLQAGEAVVTVTSQADATKKASCTVTVTDNVTLRYEKVTSIDDLADGDKVLIVAPTQNKAAGAFGTKNFAGVDVTIDADVILSTNAVGATVFTLGKDGDKWTISDNGNLVGREGTELREGSGNTSWSITISAGCDTILSQIESYGDRFFVYNNNNTSLFAAYASYDNNKMHPVKLFREAGKELVDVEPTGIIVNPSTQEVVVGSTLQLDAVILPAVSMYRDVVWESMAPTIATVDDAGLVSAIGVGDAKIVAKSARNTDITDTCFLSVRDSVHVESVTIKINNVTKTSYSMRETKTVQLTAVITPENADVQQVEWRSSDETVATVSADGLVSALEAGTAIITADSKDRGVKAELTLTVSGTPRIEVNKTEIAFANVVYKGVKLTHRDSIAVEGKWLTDPINVRITGEGFSANVSELPKEGGKLYIDYSIEKGGDFEGQVILSTEGALAVSVSLSLHADEEMTIAKILEREPEKGTKTGTNQYLLNDVVVTYQNGNKLYVRDATGSLLITNATGTFENGTILKGIVGRIDYVKYNPEMVMSVQPTSEAGPVVQAEVLTTYPVRKDISKFVILKAVKFNKAVTLNATTKEGSIKFDNGNLTVYNTYEKTFAAVDTRHVYNILGTIMKFGDNYYEVSPIEIAVSTDPYMYAEYTFAYFDDNEIDASGKAIGSEVIALDTLNIKELKIEGTSIFGATYENGKLTVNYVATEAGKYEGTVTVTGIPTKEGASNVVVVIDCDVTIAAYSDPVITVDKDEIVFDSITVKYMEHQTGSAVVTVTTQNVKNLTVSNSNKDVFNAVLNGNKLTISYDVYKGGEFNTTITLKGEPEVAGKKVDNVTIRARISVGQYPDEQGFENVNAERGEGLKFNILGQRVDDNYRGIVIENGKKKLVK